MEFFNQDKSIDTLDLSVRARNALLRSGYKIIADLLFLKPEEIISIRNVGKRTVDEILSMQHKLLYDSDFTQEATRQKELEEVQAQKTYVFKGIKGLDLPISDTDLSVRAKNTLQRHNYVWISEILDLDLENVMRFRNIGVKTAEEIINFIKWHQSEPIAIVEVPKLDSVYDDIVDRLVDYFYEQLIPINCPVNPLRHVLRGILNAYANACPILSYQTAINDTALIDSILNDALIQQYLESMVIGLIQCDEFGISLRGIQWSLPEIVTSRTLETILKKLLDNQTIVLDCGIYHIAKLSFQETIENMSDDRIKSIMLMRISGMTLEHTGNSQGVTRERVRQIEAKTIRKINNVTEDKYQHLYEKYSMPKELFISVFNETETAYYYLSQKYEKGKRDFFDAIHDRHLPIQIINRIEQYSHKDHIEVNGEYLECNRDTLISYILKTYCTDEISFDDFLQLYDKVSENISCNQMLKLKLGDKNGVMNRMMDRADMLWKQNKRLRYYNLASIDPSTFYDQLSLLKYNDQTISTLKLFCDNATMMREYDIRDEYELHNILRKTPQCHKKYGLIIQRMPTITIGEGNMQEQIYQTLLEHAPISIDDLAALCEHKYGIKSNTFKATQVKPFDRYYHDGMYRIDFRPLPLEVRHVMQHELPGDYYQLDYVYKKYFGLFPDQPRDLLNPYTLKELGFLVFSDYIIRDKYQNAQAYMIHVLTNEKTVDMDGLPRGLETKSNFCSVLASLKANYDIIEYEPRKYVTIKVLEEKGVTKKSLKSFCDGVYNAYQGKGFFTIFAMKTNWLFQSLPQLDYSDKFYESVLEQDVRFQTIHIGSGHIFTTDLSCSKPLEIVRAIAEGLGTRSLDLIEEEFKAVYGLRPKRDKLNSYIRMLDAEVVEG
jgi:hypothetical protein